MNATVIAGYTATALRKALGMKKKTGAVRAWEGWSYNGSPIYTLQFESRDRVTYLDHAGKIIARWDGTFCGIDD